ncbi:MAG: hypothetical protein KJ025_09530 [Burkholderiales bacterium]|nr:hypothetical protein [Burkholderiales bacterium]
MAETDPRKPQDGKQENPPELAKGPGGLTMREIHEQVKKSLARDRAAQKTRNQLAQPQNRWQRFVRYVWDRKGGDGRR